MVSAGALILWVSLVLDQCIFYVAAPKDIVWPGPIASPSCLQCVNSPQEKHHHIVVSCQVNYHLSHPVYHCYEEVPIAFIVLEGMVPVKIPCSQHVVSCARH